MSSRGQGVAGRLPPPPSQSAGKVEVQTFRKGCSGLALGTTLPVLWEAIVVWVPPPPLLALFCLAFCPVGRVGPSEPLGPWIGWSSFEPFMYLDLFLLQETIWNLRSVPVLHTDIPFHKAQNQNGVGGTHRRQWPNLQVTLSNVCPRRVALQSSNLPARVGAWLKCAVHPRSFGKLDL